MFHLVDSNVILDIFTADPKWYSWANATLLEYNHHLAINPIIYAEVSIGFKEIDHFESNIEIFKKLPLPFEAGFLAGKVYMAYRQNKGKRDKVLPDFYIGAHAAIQNLPLITRDINIYKTYFPTVKLIHP